MWWVLWIGVSRAYETDQLTDRDTPLGDATARADEEVNFFLDLAIAATNAKTRCEGSDEEIHQRLVKNLHNLTSSQAVVPDREAFASLGYRTYAAFLETDAQLPRRSYLDRSDIFGDIPLNDSLILGVIGPCSTLSINGVLVGTDKLDHFFDQGFDYVQESRWGQEPERAIRWGTFSELSFFGYAASNAFSYGDLRANYDGYRFFMGLFAPGGLVERDDRGCVRQVRDFTWKDYVTWEYDEVLNPSVFSPAVRRYLDAHLQANQATYCASYEAWGAGYSDHLAANLGRSVSYVAPFAPKQVDVFQLDALCREGVSAQ